MLQDRFHKVIGVEPNDLARKYAAHHYPRCVFANDAPAGDVVVMVEVIEHLTMSEFSVFLPKAHTLAITTPLIEHPFNDFHEKTFRTAGEVSDYVGKWGFQREMQVIDLGITFTTSEVGDQFIGVYRR